MMKNIFLKVLIFLCLTQLLMSQLCFAQTEAQSEVKFAFVNIQEALQKSKAGQKAQKIYEDAVKKEQGSIDKMKKEYQEKKSSFEKQKAGLNKAARSKKSKELSKLEGKMKKAFQDSQLNLRKKNSKIVGDLIQELRKTVEKFGSEKSYKMIFEKGSGPLLYGDSSVDVTSEIVTVFDKRTKDMKF